MQLFGLFLKAIQEGKNIVDTMSEDCYTMF